MQLIKLKSLGRFRNSKTGQVVNIWMGVKKDLSGHVRFWIRRGTRWMIDSSEFYTEWEEV